MSADQKHILKKVLHAGIDLVRVCVIAELESQAPAILYTLGITPAVVIDAIAQFADEAVQYLNQRRRRLDVLTYMQNVLVDAGTAVANAARTVGARISAVANSMQAAAKQLNELTGSRPAEGMANIGCPAVMYAIKAGISAQFPGIIVPV
jgi:hypothetical protein